MAHPAYQKLLKSNEAIATTLVTMLIDEFGTECLNWAPKTIIMEVEEHHHVTPIQGNIDRMMAGIHLLTSNSFFTSLPDFNDLCNILAGEPTQPGVFIPADAASCAWGITEAMLLSPPEDEEQVFTEDIRAFVGEVLSSEGIMTPPDVLRIAHFDKDLVRKVQGEYTDDPDMFTGIYKVEESKTSDINTFIQTRLRSLVQQLASMPLRNGNVSLIVDKMLRVLPAPEDDTPLP